MSEGKFIVLYGVNNLGKTTQARLLVDRIDSEGHSVQYLKYPLYDLEPTGPIINEYLREGNPYSLTAREFQIIQHANRLHYDFKVREILASGMSIVSEDYRGTSIAWGIGTGVDKNLLVRLNSTLVPETVAILVDGKRFTDAKEEGHAYEEQDDLTERVRKIHQDLAQEFGWHTVNGNQTIEEVHKSIWEKVKAVL